MTVAVTSPINAYVGAGNTNAYAFTFPIFSQTQLLVTVVSPAPASAISTLVLGTDYTVSGLNASGDPASTGTITLVNSSQAWLTSGNLTTSWQLVVQSNFPLSQTTSFRNGGDFYRSALEDALDILEYQIQQLNLALGSQLILPTGLLPSAFSPILPSSLASSPGLAIVVNGTGTGLALGAGNAVTIPVTVPQGGTGQTGALAGNRVIKSSGQTMIEAAAITANRALTSDANGIPVAAPSGLTDTQLGSLITLFSYRRPVLQYISSTTATIETGIDGTSGEAKILFPDGQILTDSTSGDIVLDLTRVAAFASGTIQSGLRTGSVVSNTWYAVYAVKVTKVGSTTRFVLVADTVTPVQANFATLNSNFGTNSWAYLGMIRYGDQNTAPSALVSFIQIGNRTYFRNTNVGNTGIGINLADATGTSATYSGATGTTGAVVPAHCPIAIYSTVHGTGGSGNSDCVDSGSTHFYYSMAGAVLVSQRVEAPISDGLKIRNGASIALDIDLAGFIDSVLAGPNALL